jgi:hypothetical protein
MLPILFACINILYKDFKFKQVACLEGFEPTNPVPELMCYIFICYIKSMTSGLHHYCRIAG